MKKSTVSILLLLLILISMISWGCTKEEEAVVTINDNMLTENDFLYDIYLVETEGNSMDEYYRENFGISYWDTAYSDGGDTFRDLAKDTVLSRVIMYEILNNRAKEAGLSLSEDEIESNSKAVDKLVVELGGEKLASAHLTRDIILNAYNRLSLGDKYYLELSKDFDIDRDSIRQGISPEVYREYKTECLYAPSVIRQEQNIIPLGRDELEKSYAAIEEALKKINEGHDFTTILKEEMDDLLTKYSRSFIPEDSIPEQEYKDAAINLNKGEYSEIISTNYGYYIIHMLENNSTERYEQAVEEAIRAEEGKRFETLYNEWRTQYEIDINSDYWDDLVIGSIGL